MPCNRELFQLQLRIWLKKGKNAQGKNVLEVIDFDDVILSAMEKTATTKGSDLGCFKSFFTIVVKNKVIWIDLKVDPDPNHSNYLGRLITAQKNGEVLPAAFLYLKKRYSADVIGSESRIGVYMEGITFPLKVVNTSIGIVAETAEQIGF